MCIRDRLRPALVLLEILPAVERLGRRCIDARRRGIAKARGADEGLIQLVFPEGIEGVDIHALVVDAHAQLDVYKRQVQALQQRLIQLGFLDDEADGKYGKNTESAVEDFQEHLIAQGVENVSATGAATPITQEYLFDETRSTFLKELSLGDEDGEVRRLERRLRNLGYLDEEPDSVFDDYTLAVVKACLLYTSRCV